MRPLEGGGGLLGGEHLLGRLRVEHLPDPVDLRHYVQLLCQLATPEVLINTPTTTISSYLTNIHKYYFKYKSYTRLEIIFDGS